MPIYEYRCRQGHTFEVTQSMNDDPVATCTECRSPVERVFHPVAVHFKGSGFYTTDYPRKRGGSSDSAGSGDGKGDSKEASSTKSDGASTASNGASTKSDGGAKASESSTGD